MINANSFTYSIKSLGGTIYDLDTTDQVFSTQGATSALITLNPAPEAGAVVSVQLNGKTYAVQADAQGHWQASIPAADLSSLTEGAYTPTLSITDRAGKVTTGPMQPLTVDNTAFAFIPGHDAPEQIANLAASSDSFIQGDGLTNVTLPVFEGTAEAGALVTLSVGDIVVGSTRTDATTGAWRIATTAALAEGDYTPVVTVTDLAGNVSAKFDGAAFTIVTTAPAVDGVILAEFDPTTDETIAALYASDTPPEFDPASMGVPYENSAAVAAAGITLDLATADTGLSSTDGITMYPLPRISGTVSGHGDLMVYVLLHEVGGSGVNLKFAPIPAMDGDTWAVQVTQPLGADGETHTYVPYITVVDGAGNISRSTGQTIVIDRQAPEMATVDLVHNAPNDTGMDATDGVTNNDSPLLQGTAEAGSKVVVDVAADGTMVFTATTGADGHWTVQLDGLADGDYTPQVTVIDLAGNVSLPIDADMPFTVDTMAPDAPEINLFSDFEGNDTGRVTDDQITGNATPTISGMAEDGAWVTVTVGSWTSAPILADGGEWSIKAPTLADGTYTAKVVVTDLAGNVSEAVDGETFTVLTKAPDASQLTVGLVHDSNSDTGISTTDGITNNPTPDLAGKAPAGATVQVKLGDTIYGLEGDIQADNQGNWTFTVDDLADGVYTAQARLVDVVDNRSAWVNAVAFAVDATVELAELNAFSDFAGNDTGLVTDDLLTRNTTPTLSGMAEEGATVVLTVGNWVSSPVAVVNGNWSVQTGPLTDGSYTAQVVVTDAAGNVSDVVEGETFTVLTQAPDANQLTVGLVHDSASDTGISATDGITNNPTPDLTGTAPQGTTVLVKLGTTIFGLEGDILADDQGHWTFTVPDTLADGVYTAQARLVDVVGNQSAWVNAAAFTVDHTAPTQQSVTATLKHDSLNDTGASASDGFTQNTKPTISGTAEAGALVTVTVGDFSNDEPVQVGADGKWSVVVTTNLEDGEYTPTVTVTDRAGNMLEGFEGQMFTVDTQVDKAELNAFSDFAGPPPNDTGLVADDLVTRNITPFISGTAENGGSVVVTVGSWVSAPVKVVNGEWSVQTGTLADGNYTAKVVVTDAAGNVSDMTTGEAFTVITKAPDASQLTLSLVHDSSSDTGISATDSITNSAEIQLIGTAPAGLHVLLELGGSVYGEDEPIMADANGRWSVTVNDLPEGDYIPMARLVDSVGNESNNVFGNSFTVDSTVEASIDALGDREGNDTGFDSYDNITSQTSPVISGTAEVGALVTVKVGDWTNDKPIQVGADGQWSVILNALKDGEYTPELTVTDLAGNVSTFEGDSFKVDTTVEAVAVNTLGAIAGNDTGFDAYDNITNNASPVISGTAEAGAYVIVTAGEWMSDPVQVSEDGTWTVTMDALADGDYTPEVTVTDAAGNVSEVVTGETFTVLTQVPDVSQLTLGLMHNAINDTGFSAKDSITENRTPDLSGKAPAGTFVMVKWGDQVFGLEGDIVPDDQGNWTWKVPDELLDGNYTAQAQLVDVAGNQSEWINASFTVLSYNTSAAENSKSVTTIELDPDVGAAPRFTLTGADARLFKISSKGVLTFSSVKDYEQPVDSNHDGVYEVSVTMTNTKTRYAVTQDLTVGVEFVPINGTTINDTLRGTDGWDTLDGLAGDDRLTGGKGSDTFIISSGHDTVTDFNLLTKGATNQEVLQVSQGAVADAILKAAWTATEDSYNDGIANLISQGFDMNLSGITQGQGWNVTNKGSDAMIIGSQFDDVLTGGTGNDQLLGGTGDDVLAGGKGYDILTGNTGADTFRLSGDTKTDHITDFLSGTDHIDLDHLIFKALGTGELAQNQFVHGTSATTATQRIIYDQPTGNLWYDADGSGRSKAVLIGVLDNHVKIEHTDFWVI